MEYTPFPWWRLVIYDLLLWILNITFDCFFREIRSRNAFKIPTTGPVIFVGAPHANQFVDPVILMNQVKKESGRRISFLIAAKSYRLKVIGWMSKCQLSIPVERAQDNLKPAKGKIFIDFNEPNLVKGEGTEFTSFLKPKCLLALPNSLGASEIDSVIDDTTLLIRKPFNKSEKIVDLLSKGTGFKYAEKIDQNEVYHQVFNHLSHGNCLGIFPEGGSHDRTDLLPIKAGVAIMALGAMANNPQCNVKIVPCGMNYFNAHKFRSRAVIEYGTPIEIPREMIERYQQPENTKEVVKDLLDLITSGLKAVTVTCDSYETLMVVQAARRLYAQNFASRLPLPLVVEMNRRLVLGYETFKNEVQVQQLKAKILTYNEQLQQLYLPDHHVETFDENAKFRNLGVLLYRIIKLFVFVILALPGAILFSPVFIIAKRISSQKKKAALANSVVKIQANDVVATWKILVSLVIAPIFYSFYASIAVYYFKQYYTYRLNGLLLWLSLYCFNVLITYSALITGEQGMDLFKSIRPLYLSLTDGSSIKELKSLRKQLIEDITEAVNEFGYKLFPKDFNLLELNDEEEETITMNLKRRRQKKQDSVSSSNSSSSLNSQFSSSSSMSDGVSFINSHKSFSNIPVFSDYQLFENKNSDTPNLSRSGSSLELNFKSGKLSDLIKNKIREKRDKVE